MVKTYLKTVLSKILLTQLKSDIGLQYEVIDLSDFLKTAVTLAGFQKRRETYLPWRQIKQFTGWTTNSVFTRIYHTVINIIWSRCFLRIQARDNQMSFMSCSGLKYSVAKNSNVYCFHQVAHEKHSKNQPLLEWRKDLVNHFWYTAEICNTQEEYIVSKM